VNDEWKPINYKGHWNYDPRGELLLRAQVAQENNDDYVAIPVKLAIACGKLRECGATTILTGDEDGPLSTPLQIQCRKPEKHSGKHYNGYCEWDEVKT